MTTFLRSHRPYNPLVVASLAATSTLLCVPMADATTAAAEVLKPQPTVAAAASLRPAPAWEDAAVQALLDARVADGRAVGLAVAIVEPDGRVRFFNAGATAKGADRVSADTIFEIGSITKVFTGVLLAQGVERGRLRLDDSIRKHAPAGVAGVDLPPGSAGDITLRQLATHTSGLPRLPISWPFFKSMLSDPDNPYKSYSADSMWRYLAARKHDLQAAHAPEYSNLGFGVLGEALAARESLTYAALVQRDVAGPLAMRDTGITTAPEATSRLAKGHDAKLNTVAYWDLPAMPGAGALRSTARDMAAFVRAAQSGRLSGARASIQPQAVLGERRDIGLGWVRSQRGAQTIVWHNGGTGGFSSFAGFSESSGLGVVVLSNAAVSIDDIGVHLLDPTSPLASKAVKQGGFGWVGVLIVFSVWLASVLAPWRLRFGTPPAAQSGDDDLARSPTPSDTAVSSPASRWRRLTVPRYVTSRADSVWVALEVALVSVLLGVFGPWGTLGLTFKWLVVASLLASAVLVLVRARHLAWRDAAPMSKSKLFGRVVTALLGLGVLALWLG